MGFALGVVTGGASVYVQALVQGIGTSITGQLTDIFLLGQESSLLELSLELAIVLATAGVVKKFGGGKLGSWIVKKLPFMKNPWNTFQKGLSHIPGFSGLTRTAIAKVYGTFKVKLGEFTIKSVSKLATYATEFVLKKLGIGGEKKKGTPEMKSDTGGGTSAAPGAESLSAGGGSSGSDGLVEGEQERCWDIANSLKEAAWHKKDAVAADIIFDMSLEQLAELPEKDLKLLQKALEDGPTVGRDDDALDRLDVANSPTDAEDKVKGEFGALISDDVGSSAETVHLQNTDDFQADLQKRLTPATIKALGGSTKTVKGQQHDNLGIFVDAESSHASGVVVHETVHHYASPNLEAAFSNYKGLNLMEGATEYFTTQVSNDTTFLTYQLESNVAEDIADVVGEQLFRKAYFEGDAAAIEQVKVAMDEYDVGWIDKTFFDN